MKASLMKVGRVNDSEAKMSVAKNSSFHFHLIVFPLKTGSRNAETSHAE